MSTNNLCLSKQKKIATFFSSENYHFYSHGHVCIMGLQNTKNKKNKKNNRFTHEVVRLCIDIISFVSCA